MKSSFASLYRFRRTPDLQAPLRVFFFEECFRYTTVRNDARCFNKIWTTLLQSFRFTQTNTANPLDPGLNGVGLAYSNAKAQS
jgi:hypothetical protein